MGKSIIIIGGGVAGLAAGCYAQMNGYDTQIFEQHFLPGGLCTSWVRGGYTFDGCISYLYGSGDDRPFNDLWQELGVAGVVEMIDLDEFIRVRGTDGVEACAFADPDRLEAHLLDIAPEDRRVIHALCRGVRACDGLDMSILSKKPRAHMTPVDWGLIGLKMLPYWGATARWMHTSAAGFARRFGNPFLRRAFPFMLGWPEIPMLAGLTMLASMHAGNAGYPKGGSLGLARAMENRYLELGGTIHYEHRVERILVRKDRAYGVRLYTDEEFTSDYVISAADFRTTAWKMLRGEYTRPRHRRMYDGRHPIHSQIQVSVGLRRDMSREPNWVVHLFDEPVVIGAEERDYLSVKNFSFDPTLAPADRSIVEVFLRINYEYWQHIYGHKLYKSEQVQVEDQVIEQLDRIYPGLGEAVEIKDVATPLSYERYTTNWQGSSCGWLLTPTMMRRMLIGMPKTLPGLQGLYLAGQWVEPGGSVPICAASGKNAVQMVCRADGRRFSARGA